MLIQPWDAASQPEWSAWLSEGRDFGQLVANGDPWPVVVPTHFVVDDDRLLVHLARHNPIRSAVVRDPSVVLTVTDDYAYIPTTWRAGDGEPPSDGVPTSYYSSVHFHCRAHLVDEAPDKAALLSAQLEHFQPDGDHGEVAADHGPYHRMLNGIFGLSLEILEVRAKFKYDDHKPAVMRENVMQRLEDRGGRLDLGARSQQARRLRNGH